MTAMTRQDRLEALADLHAQWVEDNLPSASKAFDPSGRKKGSDYNQHHVDLDADGEAQDEFANAALELFGDAAPAQRSVRAVVAAELARLAGHDVTPGHDELHHYWTKGEGLAKWVHSPHPWTALYHHLVKHVNPEMAKRMASKWFHEVLGFWPGQKHVGAVRVPRAGRSALIGEVVAAELDELLRKFDPHQPRDPFGQWIDIPNAGAVADKLNLDGLGPFALEGARVRASDRFRTHNGASAMMALTDTKGVRHLRLGVVATDDEKKWSGSNLGSTVILDDAGIGSLRQGLTKLREDHAEQVALKDDLIADVESFDGFDEGAQLSPRQQRVVDQYWKMADAGKLGEGTLASGPWGDVRYLTLGNDTEGVDTYVAVRPTRAGAGWSLQDSETRDAALHFDDPAQIAAFLRSLEGVIGGTPQGARSEALLRTFDPHQPRDPTGKWSLVGAVRQALADAGDIDGLNQAAAAEAKRITGLDIPFDMTGADLDVAKQHCEGIIRGLERFPDAGLVGVHTYGPDRPLAGAGKEQDDWAGVTRSHGVIVDGKFVMQSNVYFNTGVAAGELQSNLRQSAESGYLVSGTPMGTALHEYGHVVAQSRGSARDVYDHAVARADAAGATPQHYITKHVSGYATSSMGEFSAEIFADVMEHGDSASELSRSSFAIIEGDGA